MGIAPERIARTAHWADGSFRPQSDRRSELFPRVASRDPVLLFAGRLSEEKGIFELPELYRALRHRVPALRLVVPGEGPAEERLRSELPEAVYLGWVGPRCMPNVFSSADLLVLPSRFDTFGCVVLEAMSCGLPVAAYNTKGPRDLIEDGASGFLVDRAE